MLDVHSVSEPTFFSQVAHSYKLLGLVFLTRGKVEQARKYLTKVSHLRQMNTT